MVSSPPDRRGLVTERLTMPAFRKRSGRTPCRRRLFLFIVAAAALSLSCATARQASLGDSAPNATPTPQTAAATPQATATPAPQKASGPEAARPRRTPRRGGAAP